MEANLGSCHEMKQVFECYWLLRFETLHKNKDTIIVLHNCNKQVSKSLGYWTLDIMKYMHILLFFATIQLIREKVKHICNGLFHLQHTNEISSMCRIDYIVCSHYRESHKRWVYAFQISQSVWERYYFITIRIYCDRHISNKIK